MKSVLQTRSLRSLRWALFAAWLVAAAISLTFALSPALTAVGLAPDLVTFGPAMLTGAPWTLPLVLFEFDSITRLAVIFVAHLLNAPIGLMLARGED
jgi:hypothetical protein